MYIVGSRPEVITRENRDLPNLVVYYIDTRPESIFYDSWSDIFDSSLNPSMATKYDSYEEAQQWNEEFLDGEGLVYLVVGSPKRRVK